MVIVLALASPAWAGSFSVTTTREQDAAIAWTVAQRNAAIQAHNATAARRGVPLLPPLTAADVVQGVVSDGAAGLVGSWTQTRQQTYREKIDGLDAAARARVLQDLGVSE